MSRRVSVVVFVVLLLTCAGVVVPRISQVRDGASRMQCMNNLKQCLLAVHGYHDANRALPSGTIRNPNLPIEKRLSWLAAISPYLESGSPSLAETKGWDEGENRTPKAIGMDGWWEYRAESAIFLCPANSNRAFAEGIGMTHYVGIAGTSSDAASLTLDDRRCGVFGYDRKITLKDITDGTNNTLLAAETATDNGPWTAGGRATVRGLDTGGGPYFGESGQFNSVHRERNFLSVTRSTNVAFADGSVRKFSDAVSPQVFEALATIAGGEKVEPFVD